MASTLLHHLLHLGTIWPAWILAFVVLLVRATFRERTPDWVSASDEIPLLLWACFAWYSTSLTAALHPSVPLTLAGSAEWTLGSVDSLVLVLVLTLVGRRIEPKEIVPPGFLRWQTWVVIITVVLDHLLWVSCELTLAALGAHNGLYGFF